MPQGETNIVIMHAPEGKDNPLCVPQRARTNRYACPGGQAQSLFLYLGARILIARPTDKGSRLACLPQIANIRAKTIVMHAHFCEPDVKLD